MGETTKYFVVKQKAIPEVLLKVVEAKRLLESEKVLTIQEAVDAVGISRSSFYKYKDDIFPFHDNSQGTTITLTFQMDDEPGILSDVLKIIAEYRANILTIHQSIPINGIASLTLSIQVLQTTGDISRMIEQLEGQPGEGVEAADEKVQCTSCKNTGKRIKFFTRNLCLRKVRKYLKVCRL